MKVRDIVIIVFVLTIVGTLLFLLNKKTLKIDRNNELPMIVFDNKDKLWQIVTYDDDNVTALEIDIYPKYSEKYKKVYINYRSQFVFFNGEPILLNNEPIFWNRRGDIVDYNYNVINESMVFYIDKIGMPANTAMTLKNLKMKIRSNVLREQDKIREMELEKITLDKDI